MIIAVHFGPNVTWILVVVAVKSHGEGAVFIELFTNTETEWTEQFLSEESDKHGCGVLISIQELFTDLIIEEWRLLESSKVFHVWQRCQLQLWVFLLEEVLNCLPSSFFKVIIGFKIGTVEDAHLVYYILDVVQLDVA